MAAIGCASTRAPLIMRRDDDRLADRLGEITIGPHREVRGKNDEPGRIICKIERDVAIRAASGAEPTCQSEGRAQRKCASKAALR